MSGGAQHRLPALLAAPEPVQRERPARWLRKGSWAGGLTGTALLIADGALGTGGEALGAVGGAVVVAAVGSALASLVLRGTRASYPHLGRLQAAWRAAGATPRQLAILDEAYRLRALTPPVGYRDRRTTVNPLADAYAIVTSTAWRDPWLSDHELLVDPIAEAAEILDYLYRVTSLLTEVGRHLRVLPAGSPAHRTYLGYRQALLDAIDDGLRRARALTAYRTELTRLGPILASSRALPAAEAFGDRVMDVVSEATRQELATRHLDDSRAQLQMVEHGLREITDLLSTTPELPAQPRR